MKLKCGDCVLHPHFGPLYVTKRTFRDSGGTVHEGLNWKDGTSYQFYPSEVARKLSREEFDRMPKCVK